MTLETKAGLIASAPRTVAIVEEMARLLNGPLDIFSAAKVAIIKQHKGEQP